MIGNLVNNRHLLHLRDQGLINITPFDEDLLRTVHYPLSPKIIYGKERGGGLKRLHCFPEDPGPFTLQENQYVVVEVRELILIGEGIIGQFIPASNLIEQGLGLTAGRLEHPFGQRGETIRFGLKNLIEEPNEVRAEQYLAYIQFFDLRGLGNNSVVLTRRDIEVFAQRIAVTKRRMAEDGGVFYPPEGEEFHIKNR